MKKPEVPARDTIAPSDLTFGFLPASVAYGLSTGLNLI